MPHRITTHASLLARVSMPGDADAWREFCLRYGDLIRGFVRRRGAHGCDADDIMQDVLMTLTKSMPGFRYDPGKGKFRGYLKTLVIRAIYKKTFQKRRDVQLEDIEAASANAGVDEEAEMMWEVEWRQYHIAQAMETILVEFNQADRDAYQRYAIEACGAQETADVLGMNVDQVYKAKSRILRRLGELIEIQTREEG